VPHLYIRYPRLSLPIGRSEGIDRLTSGIPIPSERPDTMKYPRNAALPRVVSPTNVARLHSSGRSERSAPDQVG